MNEAAPRHWMAEGLGCIQGEVIDAPVVDGDYYRLVTAAAAAVYSASDCL